MNVFLFLEDPRNHHAVKLLLIFPLFLAVLLLVDGFLPEEISEQKEFHIYGYTGSGRYAASTKYLKTPDRQLSISNEVYYDLDHLQPIQLIKTPLLGTTKSLMYKSREQPDTSYEYQKLLSVYGCNSLWVWILAGSSCVALFAQHSKASDYASTATWTLAILLLLTIFF